MKKNKTNNKKHKIYFIINSILLAWVSITTLLIIKKYDVLPFKYFIWILLAFILIPGIMIFLMLKKNIKSIIKKIISVFSIIFIIINVIALIYLNKTFKFLNTLVDTGYTIENYAVIVLKDKEYNDIKDIENKNIGYYNQEQSHIGEALTKLDELVTVNKSEYENYDVLVDKLYNEETDAIIMEESHREIIDETKENFTKDTKVIYTIEVKYKTEDIAKNVDVKKETFNIYLSGIDTYGDISSVSRSDVNIIATVNPTTHQILLTTIPRDYYVQLAGTTGLKDKLTHAGIYGIDTSIKTLENLLDIEINYYIRVNFSSVERIIEALGGVDVYSEYTFQGASGTYFQNGYNRVNGSQALEFARTRKTVDGGDRTRGKNQQALIQAIIKKACSKDIITKYSSLLNSLEGTFQTNMPMDKITDLVKKQIDDMAQWNITSISLDGSNGSEYTYSYSWQLLYVMIPDESTIENAKAKIKEVSDNQILEGSYIENTGSVNNPGQSKPQTEKKEEPKKEEEKEEKKKTTTETKPVEQTKPTETVEPKKEETKPVDIPTETVETPVGTTTEEPKETIDPAPVEPTTPVEEKEEPTENITEEPNEESQE